MQHRFIRSVGRLIIIAGVTGALGASCVIEESGDDDDDDGGSAAAECGDGKVNDAAEECDGADFGVSSCLTQGQAQGLAWDGGDLSCDSSCKIVSEACVILDEDQDQLNIFDEQALGTDPLNPDTDGDSSLDGVEVQAGSDPLNLFSWPQGVGAWPNRLAIGLEEMSDVPLGRAIGDRLLNEAFIDQFGQPIKLHQFYGYVTVLSVGAVWCGPCNTAAQGSQALWDQHREQGVVFVEQLVDGNTPGVDATEQDINNWVVKYGMQFPVVRVNFPLINVSSLPTFFILDKELVIRDKIEGWPGDAAFSTAINNVVAAQQ